MYTCDEHEFGHSYLCTVLHLYQSSSECFTVHPGSPVRGIGSTFGAGSGPITLDNVVCAALRTSLLSCSHSQIFQHNCDHSEDVAVVCDGEPI